MGSWTPLWDPDSDLFSALYPFFWGSKAEKRKVQVGFPPNARLVAGLHVDPLLQIPALCRWVSLLGPPVERLEYGYQLFDVVYFSRGTLPQKGKRALLENLASVPKRRPCRGGGASILRVGPYCVIPKSLLGLCQDTFCAMPTSLGR